MTAIEFVNFFAMLTIAFVVIRMGEVFGPAPVSTALGAVFHA